MRRLPISFAGQRAELIGSDLVGKAERPAYWVADHCYALDGEIVERQLLPAAQQIWDMCLDFVADAVVSDRILASLGLPERTWDAIHASWQRMDPLAVARFDFAYDGAGSLKLHECNADVVGHVYEAATFQARWFQYQKHLLTPPARQFDGLENALGQSLIAASRGRPIELLHVGRDPYDRLMLHAVEEALSACGHDYDLITLTDLSQLDALYPQGADSMPFCVKDFRWEHLVLDPSRAALLDRLAPRMTSPLWSVILESKGSLPWLWSRNSGHPNLLPAWFTPQCPEPGSSWARKPLFSIRGNGVVLSDAGINPTASPLNEAGIFQKLHLLPRFEAGNSACWASTGVFIVGNRPVALCITESDSPIITQDSDRTVPHVLI